MNDITIGQLVDWGQVIVTIVGIIVFAYNPIKKYNERLSKLEQSQKEDDKNIKALEQDLKMVLKGTKVLIAHSITNNETGELKKVQSELDDYLINK